MPSLGDTRRVFNKGAPNEVLEVSKIVFKLLFIVLSNEYEPSTVAKKALLLWALDSGRGDRQSKDK